MMLLGNREDQTVQRMAVAVVSILVSKVITSTPAFCSVSKTRTNFDWFVRNNNIIKKIVILLCYLNTSETKTEIMY